MSGEAEPDTIIVNHEPWKKSDENWAIKTTTIGEKKSKVVLDDEQGGSKYTDVSKSDAEKISLDKEMCLRLAKLAVALELKFGSPRDVEFSVSNNKIYLLQSRPITSFETWTDYELTHELDTATASKVDIYTRANVGEVMPGAMTTLSLTTINKCDPAREIRSTASPIASGSLCPSVISSSSSVYPSTAVIGVRIS